MYFHWSCGPTLNDGSRPCDKEIQAYEKFDWTLSLDELQKVENEIDENDISCARARIKVFTSAIPQSMPLILPKPFSMHSYHDRLMKITRMISDKKMTLLGDDWHALLKSLDGKDFSNTKKLFTLTTAIEMSVLQNNEPRFSLEVITDFTDVSEKDLKTRNQISEESFWQRAFLFPGDRGRSGREDTSAVIVRHDGSMVAILEFKNAHVSRKQIDLRSAYDLTYVVATTPGYVSSVARFAAYARFSLGKKMFEEFFSYARKNKIAESYLHVRSDNPAAIKLYESLGYSKVGSVLRYYSDPPVSDADVMRKVF